MRSMTGFGYIEGEESGSSMTVEIKSYNARYLDISITLPPALSTLENRLHTLMQGLYTRGRLEITVKLHNPELMILLDVETAAAWKKSMEDLAGILDIEETPSLKDVMDREGVCKVKHPHDAEFYRPFLEDLIRQAADQVTADREREGAALARDLESQLKELKDSLDAAVALAPKIRKDMEDHFKTWFQEILGNQVEEGRVLTEAAAWIAKSGVNEELVRLGIHIDSFRKLAAQNGMMGKKLDFLAQEMGREINTLGSKSPKAELIREVITMKDALEKIREQLRNVE